jgi:formate hydrogenlyase subunit 4
MNDLAYIQWALTVALAPLVMGLIQWLKARLQARQGPSILQPYRDLWKLAHKHPVWPNTTSPVFGLMPYLVLGANVLLVGLVSGVLGLPGGSADLLTIIFLIALTKFVTALAALDTSSPLTALGGSRVMFLHALAEPTLVALAYAHALLAHSLGLSQSSMAGSLSQVSYLLIGMGLLGMILLETGRLPFDNVESRLELTMIENAIALEYSGPELAAWEWAGAIRLSFFFSLIASSFSPIGSATETDEVVGLLYVAVYLALILGLAWWETVHSKYRIRAILGPGLLPLMLALSALLFDFISNFLQQ